MIPTLRRLAESVRRDAMDKWDQPDRQDTYRLAIAIPTLLDTLDRLAAAVRAYWFDLDNSRCWFCGEYGYAPHMDAPLSLAAEHHKPDCIVPLAEAVGRGEVG